MLPYIFHYLCHPRYSLSCVVWVNRLLEEQACTLVYGQFLACGEVFPLIKQLVSEHQGLVANIYTVWMGEQAVHRLESERATVWTQAVCP